MIIIIIKTNFSNYNDKNNNNSNNNNNNNNHETGNWKNGFFEGKGAIKYVHGDSFEGHFLNGFFYGEGF
jgi:hypothetical protein